MIVIPGPAPLDTTFTQYKRTSVHVRCFGIVTACPTSLLTVPPVPARTSWLCERLSRSTPPVPAQKPVQIWSRLLGRLMGKALKDGRMLDLPLALPLCALIVGLRNRHDGGEASIQK